MNFFLIYVHSDCYKLHKLNGQMLPLWYFYLTCYFQEKFVLISFVTFAVIVAHPNMFSAVTSEYSTLWRQVYKVKYCFDVRVTIHGGGALCFY